jgi:hypothetical protein
MQNVITYKGFDFSFFFQFTKQTGYNYLRGFDAPGSSNTNALGVTGNQPAFVMERWRETDRDTHVQKFAASPASPAISSYLTILDYDADNIISDASFIRLQNVSLEWQIPKALLKRAGFAGASLYIQGQNLFTITNYYGFDPTTTSFRSLPTLRVISLGAKVSL